MIGIQINICWSLELLILYFPTNFILFWFRFGTYGGRKLWVKRGSHTELVLSKRSGMWSMGKEVHSEMMQSFCMYLWYVHTCSIEFGRRDILPHDGKKYI